MTKEREIISIEYTPAMKGMPAQVDISWYNEELGKNGYALLEGKAAKALSQLKPGDIFYDKTYED